MSATSAPQQFVLASGNAHKLREFTALLAPHGIGVLPAPPNYQCLEDGTTFAANALLKARAVQASVAAAQRAPAWVLADDSGLEVDGLGGAPGVYSARYAAAVPAGGDQDAANRAALLGALQAAPQAARTARFVCALVALPPEPGAPPVLARGELGGHVATHERGAQGFGYDSLFVPHGEGGRALAGTLAELGPAVKDSMSHRARALVALMQSLRGG